MMRWIPGRQGTGYLKLRLAGWGQLFDVWLLRYPEGAYIDWHRDPVNGRRHYRANLVLRQARWGGWFACRRYVGNVWSCGRREWFVVFRPDLVEHAVTPIMRGSRWVLSVGWTRRA